MPHCVVKKVNSDTACVSSDVVVLKQLPLLLHKGKDLVKNDEDKPTTPLLSERSTLPRTAPGRRPSGPQPVQPVQHDAPKSARQLKNSEIKEKQFCASVDEIAKIELKTVCLPTLDKSLQDHATLHNSVLENHQKLRAAIHDYKSLFVEDTAGIPVMDNCIQSMKDKCGSAQLSVGRKSKHCIQIDYDAQDVSRESTDSPEDIIAALELYNRINKLCKEILDKAPNVSRSVQLILNDESGLRKEVTKADLGPMEGPQAMKNCVENIGKLRRIPSAMESMQRDTKRIFDQILKGSKNLFENTEPKFVAT